MSVRASVMETAGQSVALCFNRLVVRVKMK